jgi:uncharacterized protein HemX
MNEFNQNAPFTPPQNTIPTPPSAPQSEGGAGALIGSIIVILVLVAGAIYFYGREVSKTEDVQNESAQIDESNLEADLQAENLDNLDSEFNSDLEAEYQ